MSLNTLPKSEENAIDEAKAKLIEFIEQSAITNFEGDDIAGLIEEGEHIDWIVSQLKSNRPNIDEAAIAKLLTKLRKLVGPVQTYESSEIGPEGNAEIAKSADPVDMPDLSLPDLAQLDLSQLVDSLPANLELPAGMDMKQLKNLMTSPQGKVMSDFLLFCHEKGVDLNDGSLVDPQIQNLQSEWESTTRDAFDGKTPAEMMANGSGLMPAKIETYRREEPRVGRNDPCPCGSGKKYKKCCGRT